MKITVPATSANVGPGFDSVGVAVSKYLTIEVLEPADHWEVLHDLGDVPSDENRIDNPDLRIVIHFLNNIALRCGRGQIFFCI